MKGWLLFVYFAASSVLFTCGLAAGGPGRGATLEIPQSGNSRRLLQQGKCGLKLGARIENFAACTTLPRKSPDDDIDVLYTLINDKNGTSTLRVAFDATTQGWVGWGFPDESGGMLGASVVIVKKTKNGTGATATPYLLADYDASSFQPGGALKVSSLQAAGAKGRLQTSFNLQLKGTPDDLTAAPMMVIYASGPVDDAGVLLPHRGRGFTTELDLADAEAAAGALPLAPAPAPAAVAARQPRTSSQRLTTPSRGTPVPAPARGPAKAPIARAPLPGKAPTASIGGGGGSTSLLEKGPAGHRRLQQGSTCSARSITMAGPSGLPTEQEYAACEPLSVGDGSFRLLYSVIDNGNGTSTLYGAYTITSPGWAGFGLPGPSGMMLQGSAVIAKPCSSCPSGASVDQYYLAAYKSSSVKPPGKLSVTNMVAEKTSTGELKASFTMLVNQAPVEDLSVIYAFGAVREDGGLRGHRGGDSTSAALPLATAVVTSFGGSSSSPLAQLAALTGGAAASGPAVDGQLAAAAAGPASLMEGEGAELEGETELDPEGADEMSAAPGLAASGPELAEEASSITGGIARTRMGGEASAAAVGAGFLAESPITDVPGGSFPAEAGSVGSGHTLTFGGQVLNFVQSHALDESGKFRIMWNVAARRRGLLQAGRTPVDVALEAVTDGWAGFGFPQEAGKMVGGSAIIVKKCPDCPTGASVDNYFLGGMSTGAVQAGQGTLDVVDMKAEATPDGHLLATFHLFLPVGGPDLPILAAIGPIGSTGTLRFHKEFYAPGTLNFASGASSFTKSASLLPKVHGIIMAVAWGFVIPFGALVAGSLKAFDPLWFQIHRAVQSIAYLAAIVGMALGLYMKEYLGTYDEKVHRVVGIVVMVLGFLQILALALRPKPDHRMRWLWTGYHQIVGVVAILLAFINAILGMRNMSVYYGYFLGFTLIWLAIIVMWIVGRCIWTKRKKSMGTRLDMQWQHAGANGLLGSSTTGMNELQMGSMPGRNDRL